MSCHPYPQLDNALDRKLPAVIAAAPRFKRDGAASAAGACLKTDWYKTVRDGVYVAVPAGSHLLAIALPAEVRCLLDDAPVDPFAADVDSHEMVLRFNFLGIDDCLKLRGYCILRT